jgi:hypothetical protein
MRIAQIKQTGARGERFTRSETLKQQIKPLKH